MQQLPSDKGDTAVGFSLLPLVAEHQAVRSRRENDARPAVEAQCLPGVDDKRPRDQVVRLGRGRRDKARARVEHGLQGVGVVMDAVAMEAGRVCGGVHG